MFALYSFLDNAQEERLGGIYHTYVHEVFLANRENKEKQCEVFSKKIFQVFSFIYVFIKWHFISKCKLHMLWECRKSTPCITYVFAQLFTIPSMSCHVGYVLGSECGSIYGSWTLLFKEFPLHTMFYYTLCDAWLYEKEKSVPCSAHPFSRTKGFLPRELSVRSTA